MEAVYEQCPMPNNVTGVPITLSVVDSNNNFREIGTTTSTPSGTFDYTWTPDISGHFILYASFAGSNSYYPSSAQTAFYASEAATTAPTQQIQSGLATTNDLNDVHGSRCSSNNHCHYSDRCSTAHYHQKTTIN